MLTKVKIKADVRSGFSSVEIGDQVVQGLIGYSLTFAQDVGEFPVLTLKIVCGSIEIEGEALIEGDPLPA